MVARSHIPDDDAEDVFDPILEPDYYEGVHFVTEEEGRQLFDRLVQLELGISGEEFLCHWDNGDYSPIPDTPEGRKIGGLVMMLPFARPTSF